MSIELSNAAEFLQWLKKKAELNAVAEHAGTRFVKRGQVYWCNFGINVGREISKLHARPGIIVQSHIVNVNSHNTIVVPVTHSKSTAPTFIPISTIYDTDGNILLEGKANVGNIMCVSKARLEDLITSISSADMKKIDEAIAKTTSIIHYYAKMKTSYEKVQSHLKTVASERNNYKNIINNVRQFINDNEIDPVIRAELINMLDKTVD